MTFNLMFSAMLMDSYRDERGTDENLLKSRRIRALTRLSPVTVHDLLFAQEHSRNTKTEAGMELLATGCANCGLIIQRRTTCLVDNLSSKELTPEQLKVLSHEACFNTTDADPVNLVATVESILKQTEGSDETKHLVRQQSGQDALKKLRADTSIVVLPADKGRSTVVLDKTDYIRKANSLLDDRQAYLRCDGEPMRKLLTQLDKTLAEMQANKVISKSARLAVKPTDAAAPRFYGLPKVHKAQPQQSVQLLSFWNGSGNELTADEVMVSFDVTSLFTSIPQDLAIETVSELLERQYDETDESVKRRHLVQLLKFCLKTYFTFEGTMYEQIKGTPMGSPLSGFIAEAVLQKLESLVFTTHRPKFWTRYVDDTFVIIKREMIEEFHSVLNSVSGHPIHDGGGKRQPAAVSGRSCPSKTQRAHKNDGVQEGYQHTPNPQLSQ
ncbi:hypothetical protein SprV_0401681600 [Sparganum proliferum]